MTGQKTPSRSRRRLVQDLAGAGAVVATAAVLCGLIYGRTTVEAWHTPIAYRGDTLSFLAQLKVAQLGYITPLRVEPIRELNAPFEGNWNDYPRLNKATFWILGLLTRPFDLILTANVLLLLAHLLAGASFYMVARYLRSSWEWAAAGALVFAFSHFAFCRGSELGHLMLCFYWHIPLCILVTGWSFRPAGLPVGSERFWWGAATAILSALQSVYYAFLFAQFLIFATVAQALRRNGWKRVAGPLVLAGAILAIGAADAAHVALYRLDHGPNPDALQRSLQDLETYALRPIRLIIPPPGHGLLRWQSPWSEHSRGSLEGENEAAYLGLAGAGALVWLSLSALRSPFLGRPAFSHPALWALGWICLYGVAGGVNGALGLLGFVFLRASNRYSIWILTLVLLFLAGRLSRACRTSRRGPRLLAALGVTAVSLADQVPHVVSRPEVETVGEQYRSDRKFSQTVEASLPPRAMVFMLPVMDYPEVPAVHHVADYDHFRPFLHSARLRFDYGSDKGRPRERWRHRVSRMNPPEMVTELEDLGFEGIIVNRGGYDDRAAGILRGLAAVGRRVTLESSTRDLLFVKLRPSRAPRRPGVPLLFGRGWYEDGEPQNPEGVWSSGDAECILTNDSPRPVALNLSFELAALAPRQVTITRARRALSSWRVSRALAISELRIPLPPGETRLTFSTDRAPDPLEDRGRSRPVAFRVSNLGLEVEPQAGEHP
jgi:phosphoglycerol transferase